MRRMVSGVSSIFNAVPQTFPAAATRTAFAQSEPGLSCRPGRCTQTAGETLRGLASTARHRRVDLRGFAVTVADSAGIVPARKGLPYGEPPNNKERI